MKNPVYIAYAGIPFDPQSLISIDILYICPNVSIVLLTMLPKRQIPVVFIFIIICLLDSPPHTVISESVALKPPTNYIIPELVPGKYILQDIANNQSKWFRFPSNTYFLKNLSIWFDPQVANLDLYLWNGTSQLCNSTNGYNLESIGNVSLNNQSDCLWFEIRNLNLVNPTTFNLTLIVDDRFEPNNRWENATLFNSTAIHQLGLFLNDLEWYFIRGINESVIGIWINWFESYHLGTISLYNQNRTKLLQSTSYTGMYATTHFYYPFPKNESYYLLINDTTTDASLRYNLHIELLQDDKWEQNDQFETAKNLYFGRTRDYTRYETILANATLLDKDVYKLRMTHFNYYYDQTTLNNSTLFDRSYDYQYNNSPDHSFGYGFSTHLVIKIRCTSYLFGYSAKFVITLYDENKTLIKRSMGELDQNGYPFSNIYIQTTSPFLYFSVDALESDYAVQYQFFAILDDEKPDFDVWNPTGNLNGNRPGGSEGYVPLYIIIYGFMSFGAIFVLIAYGVIKALKLRKRPLSPQKKGGKHP